MWRLVGSLSNKTLYVVFAASSCALRRRSQIFPHKLSLLTCTNISIGDVEAVVSSDRTSSARSYFNRPDSSLFFHLKLFTYPYYRLPKNQPYIVKNKVYN